MSRLFLPTAAAGGIQPVRAMTDAPDSAVAWLHEESRALGCVRVGPGVEVGVNAEENRSGAATCLK